MLKNNEIINKIRGGLIVSCQALENEPLHSSYIMARMAYAAMLGGASGIRANSVVDIAEIKKIVPLPIIGIIKKDYKESCVFITPTMDEVDALVECGVDIIAIDATVNIKPYGVTLDSFFSKVRKKYPNQLLMADCSTVEEGLHAEEIGFDLIGTTMSGYTSYTRGVSLPNFDMMRKLVEQVKKPVIAEGGIWSPDDFVKALNTGVHAAVVGTAITRPNLITERYVDALIKSKTNLGKKEYT